MAWLNVFKEAFKSWNDDNALRLSAALSYYSVFSLAPLLIITIGLAGLILDEEAATGQIYDFLKGYVGSQAASALQAMVESASAPKSGIIATLVGGATLLLGASGVLGQLKDALNTIWEVEIKKGVGIAFMIRTKFLNFGMVLVIGFLLLMSLVLSSGVAALNARFNEVLNLPTWIWTVITTGVSMAMVTTLFAMIFKILPDAKIQWRDVWVGALITAILFELGKLGLSWYLGRESTANAYGPASSVILLILWVYYASCILLYGAEFTQAYAVLRGRNIKPSSYAQLSPLAALSDKPTEDSVLAKEGPDVETWSPHGYVAEHAKINPIFKHRLFDPFLKYLEGRGMLLTIEAKEAFGQIILLLIMAVVCCITILVAWTLLVFTIIGLLTDHAGWTWLNAAAATCGAHFLIAAILGGLLWHKIKAHAWFEETFKELKKDRLWLKGMTH